MALTNPNTAQQSNAPMTAGAAAATVIGRRRRSERPIWMEEPPLAIKLLKAIALIWIAIIMLFPLVYVIAVSFSSAEDVLGGGLILFPANPTLEAYRAIFAG